MDEKEYEAMKEKQDEQAAMTGAKRPNPVYCNTCVHRHGDSPLNDGPVKLNCMMYYTDSKPYDVLFEGAECDYYEKEEE